MLEEILDRRNVEKAMLQVIANKGAGGVDGMQCDELRSFINTNWHKLRSSILEGTYQPSPVRKVEISKPQGGTRMLGIPTVLDRLIQQSIAQWLALKYEQGFSENSYGFRPQRNAHQAVIKAQEYLNTGNTWVIELDLEKFFDMVNHDKLIGLLRRKVKDAGTIKLIRLYLRAGIMEGGVVSQRIEGTPQGSPLSPLLSNILLDELDKELEQRTHHFVRYADDCSIYMKSEASAKRVLASITTFIETKLLLKVNKTKTKINRPNQSTLLGFSFYRIKEKWNIRISPRSIKGIKEKCKGITQRSNSTSEASKIRKLSAIIRGWVNYFVIAQAKSIMQKLDEFLRTRLRICKWKQWKQPKTKIWNLIKLGVHRSNAMRWGNSSKGYCRIAHSPILNQALTNAYYQRKGLTGFYNTFCGHLKQQPTLF